MGQLRSRARLFLRSFLAVLFLHAIPVHAQFSSPEVKEISVEDRGDGKIDESLVRVQISIKPGDTLTPAAVSKDIESIYDTGAFSNVAVESEDVGDGVKLIYVVVSKPLLASEVVVRGSRHFREQQIREWLGLFPGNRVDDHDIGLGVLRVKEEYRKDYFPSVSIAWETKESERDGGAVSVTLNIKEGRRSKVRQVVFEGNEKVKLSTLRRLLRRRSPFDPRWLFRKRRYSREELELARQTVESYYLARGYLDVRVRPPMVVLAEDGKGLIISIQIHEGVRYKVSSTALEGVALYPEAVIRKLIRLAPGEIAAMPAIKESRMAIEDYYGSRGYADTRVEYVLDADAEAGEVDITFKVEEGSLLKIRNIVIRGNTRTKDEVIRRELLINPGEIYNKVNVRNSERRLMNLGYFASVRSYAAATPVPDMKDLVFELEERPSGHFMVGAGFSSIDRLMGFIELSQSNFDLFGWPNFMGDGQKLRVSAQVGSKRQDYTLSWLEPWFLDRRLSLGFDFYSRQVNYNDYDIGKRGGSISVSRRLPGPNRMTLTYRLEHVELSDVADTNAYELADTSAPFFFDSEGSSVKSSLRLSLVHNSCDNPLVPTRGIRASLYGKMTGGMLGFDTDIYALGLRAKKYIPLWYDHVISVGAQYDVVDSFGDSDEVPLSERLFLGGGRTLRGFEYRDVGPKAIRVSSILSGTETPYYRPSGGQSAAVASAEYTIPIIPRVLRLGIFYDTGNVWLDPYELELSDLASSWGVGVRLDYPGFPIRIDRGWSIHPDDELTNDDPWVFWVGYDY